MLERPGILLSLLLLPYVRANSVTELRNSFYMNVEETQTELKKKTGAILYQSDLTFWSEIGGSGATRSIDSSVFTNFTAIAHAPVSVATILLPDLLSGRDGITYATRQRLQIFREVLPPAASTIFTDSGQQAIAAAILGSVTRFVDGILTNASMADMQSLRQFAKDLEGDMRRAAEMAVRDYFMRLVELAKELNIAFNWSVVLSVKEFSHEGSFLHQFYERVFFKVLYKSLVPYVDKRIVLLPGGLATSNCSNTSTLSDQLARAASNQIYRNTTHNIFNYGDTIHGIVADAANEVICSGSLGVAVECPVEANFPGFDSIWNRVYVILIVTFFSVSLFLLILLVSIFSEDRVVKMENLDEPKKKKKKNKLKEEPDSNGLYYGPSLLEPICDAESTNGYVTYRDLKKKHGSENAECEVSSYTPSHDSDGISERKPRTVTRTEVTLENMAEW